MPYPNPFMPQHPQQFAPYQPQGYMTAGSSPLLSQQPIHGFVYVTGIEGAKAYQMPPNSEMPLFDSTSENTMFIKTTDGAGFPTIKVCNVNEKQGVQQQQSSEYVTHDELSRVYADLSGQMDTIKGAMYGNIPSAANATEQPAGANAKHSTADGR